MNSYRPLFSTVLLASCLAGLAAPVIAAPYECGPKGEHAVFFEHRGERMEQHQKKLLEALKLTPDQEPAWKKFVVSESPAPISRAAAKPEDWSKLSSPERADRALEMMKERQTRMGEHIVALKEFYAVLTPEQRKIFDDSHRGTRRDGMRGKHMSPPAAAPVKP